MAKILHLIGLEIIVIISIRDNATNPRCLIILGFMVKPRDIIPVCLAKYLWSCYRSRSYHNLFKFTNNLHSHDVWYRQFAPLMEKSSFLFYFLHSSNIEVRTTYLLFFSSGRWIRTTDLKVMSLASWPLLYTAICGDGGVRTRETSCVQGRRSGQLSYIPKWTNLWEVAILFALLSE